VSYRPARAVAARLARSATAAEPAGEPARWPAAGYTGPREVGPQNSVPVDSAVVAEEDRLGTRRKKIATCP